LQQITEKRGGKKMKKRLAAMLLCLAMVFATLTGCGTSDTNTNTDSTPDTATSAGGTLNSVEGYAYASLDPHKEYYSWHDQKYGLTESLFRLSDDMKVEPWVAKSLDIEGNVATLTLNDGVCFSNGNPLTADMVKRNLERMAEVNVRFRFISNFKMEAKDDKTLIINMPSPMPTLKNEMASPEFCMVDLDATTDIDNNPISTGPFVVEKFIPEGDISLVRNEKYWGGKVNLDAVKFYSMRDAQSRLMAMQNGEIDAYDSLSATDIEIFKADPDQYQLFTVPSQARTYMFMKPDRIPESVRKAIILAIDRDAICAFMGGVLSPTYGVFDENVAYGKVQIPKMDLAKAKEIIEADGYKLNSNNVYEKNGKPIPAIGLYCYSGRNIGDMAVLIQEQLAKFGIPTEIKLVEDPDGTYMTDKDFDICFYRMTTDKTADPMTFIDTVLKFGAHQDIIGYGSEEIDKEIETLRFTVDPEKRAELANKMLQDFFDANVFVPLVTYNRNVVLRTGVTNFSEKNPYEFYQVNANTTAAKK
jgi:peptide/nickel transport system substrate-binding protein